MTSTVLFILRIAARKRQLSDFTPRYVCSRIGNRFCHRFFLPCPKRTRVRTETIEFSCLLVYRSGWNLGIAAVLVNVVASLILVPVAIFVFKDKLNWVNIVGILVCLAGLIMLNWKR